MILKPRVLTCLFAIAAAVVACGSTDDDGGAGAGIGGSGNSGMGGNINLDDGGMNGTGSTGSSNPTDGDASLDDLRNSACAGWMAEPEALPAALGLVVDVSRSMTARAPGTNDSKFEVTRDALRETLDNLPGSTAVGVLYYPNMFGSTGESWTSRDIDECVNTDALIQIGLLGPEGSDHRNDIDDSLDDAWLNGGTPTHDAYKYAVENFDFGSNKPFIIFLTDGQPTYAEDCVGDGTPANASPTEPIIEEIADAQENGVRTFIMGAPGSEETVDVHVDARPWLSKAARAGGTDTPGCVDEGPNFCHFDMTQEDDFGQALRSALANITGQIIQCDYELPEPPPGETLDKAAVNVVLIPASGEDDAKLIPRVADGPECQDGWQYSEDGARVHLCEQTCKDVQADSQNRLELLFGCATQGGPIK